MDICFQTGLHYYFPPLAASLKLEPVIDKSNHSLQTKGGRNEASWAFPNPISGVGERGDARVLIYERRSDVNLSFNTVGRKKWISRSFEVICHFRVLLI